ncbi:ATP-binding protein, partial [Nostoc sp. FACHB-133]|uniref:ATP-binding protein n=1 Tax=Nostoc sp. FACHB-133 TaxID=2692835 RepID=UPI0016831C56
NHGIELVADQPERNEIARLNLIAGQKAKAAIAYSVAQNYLVRGRAWLADSSWQNNYELTLELYTETTEVAYLCGEFERVESWAVVVLQVAKTVLDIVKVYEVKIQTDIAQNQPLEAINTGLQVLQQLGISFPETPTQSDIQLELDAITSLIGEKPIEDLLHLPEMTEPDKLAAMRILSSITIAAYVAAPDLMPLLVSKQVNLSIQSGNAVVSPFAYAFYGLILCGTSGNIEIGYEFGQLALNLLSHLNVHSLRARTLLIVNNFIIHWKEHIRNTTQPLLEAYQRGLEVGDLEFAAYCAHCYCFQSYAVGKELVEVEREMTKYSEAIRQIKQKTALTWNQIYQQTIANLMGFSVNPTCLVGEFYNEEDGLPQHEVTNDGTATFDVYFNKLFLCYLFSEYAQAVKNSTIAERYLIRITGTPIGPFYYLYDALARLAIYFESGIQVQEEILKKVTVSQEKMKQWAQYAPMNCLHKYHLVQAEIARVLSQWFEAEEFYEQAIQGARENEYIQEEALAYELAAKHYLSRGREKFAQLYMKEAHYCYERWGATAKVKDLETRYPQLFPQSSNVVSTPVRTTAGATSNTTHVALDLATVMKAAQAISSEIELEQLLSSLMQILIENAGAQTGCLLLENSGEWAIEASGEFNDGENISATQVLQSIPTANHLPESIINYVIHTHESVILNDATCEGNFINEPYIQDNQTQSILCLPLLNQGKLIGLLYLENKLAAGAFTPERSQVLYLLSTQAAIAIENARLYSNLETKVKERTQELSQALTHLKSTQEELIQSEKMAALGQLVAGVAHEINTPLGAIRSSTENIANFLIENLEQLPTFFQQLTKQRQQDFFALLQKSTQQTASLSSKEKRQFKKDLKRQLESQSIDNADSLANTLVNLGVCDDIQPFLPLLKAPDVQKFLKTTYDFASVWKSTKTIATATDRAAKVVFALKTYAHYDHSGEKVQVNITEGIETVITLYHNQLKHGVKVIRNYNEVPPILCYPDELNQVWVNLIHNALQAMDYKGSLRINVTRQEPFVLVSISDSGKGIPPEIIPKIFEPFFTTKPAGEGSGLGLNIVKRIMEKHQGEISVESRVGETRFTVSLPVYK